MPFIQLPPTQGPYAAPRRRAMNSGMNRRWRVTTAPRRRAPLTSSSRRAARLDSSGVDSDVLELPAQVSHHLTHTPDIRKRAIAAVDLARQREEVGDRRRDDRPL